MILACGCNDQGSVDESCDINGQCSCEENVDGLKCDACSTGFNGFPSCSSCGDTYFGDDCQGNLFSNKIFPQRFIVKVFTRTILIVF